MGPDRKVAPLTCAGTLSLAFCLILPALLILFGGLLSHGRRSRAEVDLVRGARLTAETVLALYDRSLYRNFGLLAFDRQSATGAVSQLIAPDESAHFAIETVAPLLDNDRLLAGIARHMTLRAAASLIEDAVDKVRQIRSIADGLPASSLEGLIPSVAASGYRPADPVLPYGEDGAPEWLDDYNQYMDDELRSAYQSGLAKLAPAMIPREDGSLETVPLNPFENKGLDKLGTVIDHALLVAPEGILERILLSEYALSYFKSGTPFVIRDGLRLEDRTPDGRMISSLPGSRDHEVEEIATGMEGTKAIRAVELFIGTIRFVMHLLHILTNESLVAAYRAAAEVIVAAVTAITSGEVNLPSEAVMWVLIGSAVLGQAAMDGSRLKKGHEVNLWPGDTSLNVPMRYRDYLRLLLILQPPELIGSRLGSAIAKVHPGPFYTEVKGTTD